MTREEAISLIKSAQLMLINPTTNEPVSDLYAALEMAIQALSQEQISLNDINNALGASFRNGVRSAKVEQEPTVDEMEREYEKSKALFHKIVECEDAISHKVIEDIKADIEAARYGLINDGLDVALRIIDKHIEGR